MKQLRSFIHAFISIAIEDEGSMIEDERELSALRNEHSSRADHVVLLKSDCKLIIEDKLKLNEAEHSFQHYDQL
jgi:hypothetical protein